jgi:uncharacterized protein
MREKRRKRMESIAKPAKRPLSKRKFLGLLGTLILVIALLSVSVSIYVGWSLIHPKRQPVIGTPQSVQLAYENISFHSQLGNVPLKGWWIPAQRNEKSTNSVKTVIFAHGYGDSRTLNPVHIINLAKPLAEDGYNVMMFDFRDSGESGGDLTSIGEFEEQDLLSAIHFAKEEKKSQKVALIGWSMGAVTAILAGAQTQDVSAVIADSPFADLKDYLNTNLPHWSHLPSFLFTPIIMHSIPLIAGIDMTKVSPFHVVAKLGSRPLLLIHSKADDTVPYQNSERIYQAIPDKSHTELWLTEKAGHIKTYLLQKKAYEARVLDFLDKSM